VHVHRLTAQQYGTVHPPKKRKYLAPLFALAASRVNTDFGEYFPAHFPLSGPEMKHATKRALAETV
jgi:hypothetical protein